MSSYIQNWSLVGKKRVPLIYLWLHASMESHCRCQSGLSGAYRFDINRSMRCMSIPYTQNRISTGCVTWWNVCVQSNYVQYQAMNLPTVQMDLQLSSTVPLMLSWTTVSYKQLFSSYWHTSCQGSRKKEGKLWEKEGGGGKTQFGWGRLQWIPKGKEETFPIFVNSSFT